MKTLKTQKEVMELFENGGTMRDLVCHQSLVKTRRSMSSEFLLLLGATGLVVWGAVE